MNATAKQSATGRRLHMPIGAYLLTGTESGGRWSFECCHRVTGEPAFPDLVARYAGARDTTAIVLAFGARAKRIG